MRSANTMRRAPPNRDGNNNPHSQLCGTCGGLFASGSLSKLFKSVKLVKHFPPELVDRDVILQKLPVKDCGGSLFKRRVRHPRAELAELFLLRPEPVVLLAIGLLHRLPIQPVIFVYVFGGDDVRRNVERDSMRQGVPKAGEMGEPLLTAFQIGAEFLREGVANVSVAFAKSHPLSLEVVSILTLELLFMDPNPGQVIEASKRVEHEGLDTNSGADDVVLLGDIFPLRRRISNTRSMAWTIVSSRRQNPWWANSRSLWYVRKNQRSRRAANCR
jgi:hypothetical protein